MEDAFNDAILLQKLQKLEYWKQLLFGISVCQRLLPNFIVFASQHHLEGSLVLKTCLEKAWTNILSGVTSSNEVDNAENSERVAPDTENFDSLLVSSALDAAVSISLIMRAFTKMDTQFIVDIAGLARDSVDMYIQQIANLDLDDSDFEDKILRHHLMQNELKRQRLDLEFLGALNDDLTSSIPEVKARWFNRFESCLGLQH